MGRDDRKILIQWLGAKVIKSYFSESPAPPSAKQILPLVASAPPRSVFLGS